MSNLESQDTPGVEPAPTLAAPAGAQASPENSNITAADNGNIVPDLTADDDGDSAYAGDDSQSDATSLASALYRGYTENGRKYQSLTEDKYWGPSDEKQFETMEAGHVVYWILDSGESNQLFRAPIGDNPQRIIDIGTGYGTWAIDVADKYPSASVIGVDLYPPPPTWVPPNCVFEVDDVSRDWTWRKEFDLIHMRLLLGAFTPTEWDQLYQKCFNHLRPGGWIEQVEGDVRVMSDDGTLPEDSLLAKWGDNFLSCAKRAGRPLDNYLTMKEAIEKAGFVDVQEKLYKTPIGVWPKDQVYKDAGRANREHWKSGLEGWAMWLLTKYGAPEPWSADEVRVYVAKVRNELMDPKLHIYHYTKRVWGRKPET